MKVATIGSPDHRVVVVVSVCGIGLLAGAVFLLLSLRASLNPEQAERRVRLCISRDISQRHLADLKEQDTTVPDLETATRWKQEFDRVNNLRFVSVTVRRPIPDMLLDPLSPDFVVRAVLSDEDHQHNPRYFWLSWGGIDREVSKFWWVVSM